MVSLDGPLVLQAPSMASHGLEQTCKAVQKEPLPVAIGFFLGGNCGKNSHRAYSGMPVVVTVVATPIRIISQHMKP